MSDGNNQNLVLYKSGVCEFVHGLPVDNGDILAVFPCYASLKPLPKNYFDEKENMISNKDMPAMPMADYQLASALKIGAIGSSGMTKREMFAMHAMQAMLTSKLAVNFNGDSLPDENDTLCERAVHYADALLKELEK